MFETPLYCFIITVDHASCNDSQTHLKLTYKKQLNSINRAELRESITEK